MNTILLMSSFLYFLSNRERCRLSNRPALQAGRFSSESTQENVQTLSGYGSPVCDRTLLAPSRLKRCVNWSESHLPTTCTNT